MSGLPVSRSSLRKSVGVKLEGKWLTLSVQEGAETNCSRNMMENSDRTEQGTQSVCFQWGQRKTRWYNENNFNFCVDSGRATVKCSNLRSKTYLVPLLWRWPPERCRLRGRTAAARCRPGCQASCGCSASSLARNLAWPARTPLCRVWWVHAGSQWCRWERTWHTGRRANPDCSQYLNMQEKHLKPIARWRKSVVTLCSSILRIRVNKNRQNSNVCDYSSLHWELKLHIIKGVTGGCWGRFLPNEVSPLHLGSRHTTSVKV